MTAVAIDSNDINGDDGTGGGGGGDEGNHDDYGPNVVSAELSDDYGIIVTAKDRHGAKGLRISPHVYNTEMEIEQLVEALVRIRDRHRGRQQRRPQQPRL